MNVAFSLAAVHSLRESFCSGITAPASTICCWFDCSRTMALSDAHAFLTLSATGLPRSATSGAAALASPRSASQPGSSASLATAVTACSCILASALPSSATSGQTPPACSTARRLSEVRRSALSARTAFSCATFEPVRKSSTSRTMPPCPACAHSGVSDCAETDRPSNFLEAAVEDTGA
eukprot:3499064-Pleurochrysis_carterae.AAC.2